MKILLLVITLLIPVFARSAVEWKCPTEQKFVKAYYYIKALKNVDLKQDEIIDYATQISSKCHNTFERFDEVFGITERTDLPVKESIVLSIRISLNKEIDTKNFNKIFKFLVEQKGPDAAFAEAIRLAEKASSKGKYSYDLLKEVYSFCTSQKDLVMNRRECLSLSEKVLDLGITKGTIIKDAYLYFINNKLMSLNSKMSIDLALKLLKYGDASFEDFKEIYEFALSKKGINLDQKKALDVAFGVLDKAELSEAAIKQNEKDKLK